MKKERLKKPLNFLEKILNSEITLTNLNDSVKTLRITNLKERGGTKYLIISPDNFLGKMGYSLNISSLSKHPIKSVEKSTPNRTIFNLELGNHILLCTSKKDWPKKIKEYETFTMDEYLYAEETNRSKNHEL